VALLNSTKHTEKKPRLTAGQTVWSGRLLWHPARKRNGSILSTQSPHGLWVESHEPTGGSQAQLVWKPSP